jgi:abortive infection bacteriophage resistance protein
MIIDNIPRATEYLSRLGYYRISAYWFPFRETIVGPQGDPVVSDNFKPGTRFKWATDLYAFDKALRLQLLDVLERVEVFVRTGIALQIGKHDPCAHRIPQFLNRNFTTVHPKTGKVGHDEFIALLDGKAAGSKEEFAVHFRTKYPASPMPIWIAVELLEFGQLSRLLSGIKWPDCNAIAGVCAAPKPDIFASWIRSLSVVRNTCAHHARLWNKPLIDQPRLPQAGSIPMLDHIAVAPHSNRRLYAACAIARYLLLAINPRTKWSDRLKAHMKTFPENPYVATKVMGFPENWSALPLWNYSGESCSFHRSR